MKHLLSQLFFKFILKSIVPKLPVLTNLNLNTSSVLKWVMSLYFYQNNSLQYENTTPNYISQILQLTEDAALCDHVQTTINNSFVEEVTEAQ